MKTIKLTKRQATKLNLTGVKPSRSVRVGPNSLHQIYSRVANYNTLGGLVYNARSK